MKNKSKESLLSLFTIKDDLYFLKRNKTKFITKMTDKTYYELIQVLESKLK
jgi:hypothetical protein